MDEREIDDLLYEYEHSNMSLEELLSKLFSCVYEKINELEEELREVKNIGSRK